MTDVANKFVVEPFSASTEKREKFNRLLKKRYAAEARFKMWGIAAVSSAVVFLILLLGSIILQGSSAFVTTKVELELTLDPAIIDPQGTKDPSVIANADYNAIIRAAMQKKFPEVTGRQPTRQMMSLISSGAGYEIAAHVRDNPELIGQTIRFEVLTDDLVDMLRKGYIDRNVAEADRKLNDLQLGIYDKLVADGTLTGAMNTELLTTGDSREPENAGLWGAVVGSFMTLVVTLGIAFPLGVMAAVYLEEFAPKNKFTDIIEVNINNLAAVPSIVFGLLGLAFCVTGSIAGIGLGLLILNKRAGAVRKQDFVWATLIGVILFGILTAIPFLGWFVSIVGYSWAFGALIIAKWQITMEENDGAFPPPKRAK